MSDVQRKIDWLLGRKVGESAPQRPLSAREQLGYTKDECRDNPDARRAVRKLYYAQRERQEFEKSRDIGEIPPVQNEERRKRCSSSLKQFIEEYFRNDEKFNLPWASFHLEAIRKMEASIINGGLFALALPRGSGKSSLSERAIIWAILYGYRHYIVAIGDGRSAAQEILETVQTEIESNEKLIADFPEVCYPIAQLQGIVQRATGQRYHGKPTDISWGSSGTIVFPTIDGSPSSGAILVTAGINSRLRGMKRTTSDGRELRPDFVFLDDVQNDRSASSQSQIDKRLKVIRGTVLGLAGAGRKMAGVMACTVIRRGDVADICLDRQQSPEWNGTRYGLLESMPVNEELWKQYHEIWSESQRTGHGISEATEFYRLHQREMDEGAMPTWPERFEHDELSAVQYAMDKLYNNRDTFWSEYQNQPLDEISENEIRTPRIHARERGALEAVP